VGFLGFVGFFESAYNPGPDLACNAEAVLPGLINNIDIAIFAEEIAPGQAGFRNLLYAVFPL
jgi:hypothetical protein